MPVERLLLAATAHPDPAVQRAGFALDSAYVEQCWTSMLGPTTVLLLRRMPAWWQQSSLVAVDLVGLARSLGVGATAKHSPVRRGLGRLVAFGFAAWAGREELDVYVQAPPLSPSMVARAPEAVRSAHERLLAAHLDALAVRS